jgi:hypothetical protein
MALYGLRSSNIVMGNSIVEEERRSFEEMNDGNWKMKKFLNERKMSMDNNNSNVGKNDERQSEYQLEPSRDSVMMSDRLMMLQCGCPTKLGTIVDQDEGSRRDALRSPEVKRMDADGEKDYGCDCIRVLCIGRSAASIDLIDYDVDL